MDKTKREQLLPDKVQGRFKHDRLLKIMAVTLFLLIAVIPLTVLKNRLRQKYKQQKKWAQANQQNSLQKAISDFKNDLEPEIFLQKLMQKIWPAEKLHKSILAANKLQSAEQQKVAYQKIFTQTLAHLKKAIPDTSPLFLIVVDSNLENLNFVLQPELAEAKIGLPFKKSINSQNKIAQYIAWFALLGNNHGKVYAPLASKYDHFANAVHTKSELKQKPTYFFKGVLTNFVKQLPANGLVHSYFSDIFSMQNLYFYSKTISSYGRPQGFLVAGYLENQLKFDNIKSALLELANNKNVTRFYPELSPGKTINKKTIEKIESYRIKLPNSRQKAIKLGVKVSEVLSPQLLWFSQLCEWLTRVAFLLWLTFAAKIALFNLSFPVKLRLKLALILAPAVFFRLLPAQFSFTAFQTTASHKSRIWQEPGLKPS
jgi:hypothetical protein